MPTREGGHEAETIISASVKVEGDFVSQGNVLIEGEVEGSLKTEKDLRVGEHARIAADVSAASATVAGEVRGNIIIAEKLKLEPTAKVYGDIRTRDLVIASGAVVNGKIVMDADADAPARPVKAIKTAKPAVKEAPRDVIGDADGEVLPKGEAEEVLEKEKEGTKKTINAFFTR